MNILIADDEEIIRQNFAHRIMKACLSLENIYQAGDGDEAFKIVQEKNIDIALIDINMPFKNGLDLIAEIRQQNKELVLIIISGYDKFDFAQKAITFGVFRYLLKPVDAVEFISTIEEAMQQVRQQSKSSYSPVMKKIIEIIKVNISNDDFALSDLASKLLLSEGHITKLIKKEMGKTFVDLITDMRIEHAKYLINNSKINYKMYEIAKECGFKNQYYFSQVFKKMVGISPKQYTFKK